MTPQDKKIGQNPPLTTLPANGLLPISVLGTTYYIDIALINFVAKTSDQLIDGLKSFLKPVVLPSFPTAQLPALTTAQAGALARDSTTGEIKQWNGMAWVVFGGGGGAILTLQQALEASDDAGDDPQIMGILKVVAPSKGGTTTNRGFYEIVADETNIGIQDEDGNSLEYISFSGENGTMLFSALNKYFIQGLQYRMPTVPGNAGDVYTIDSIDGGVRVLKWLPAGSSGGGDSRPYKVFTANISQAGGDAPVLTSLENTFTGTNFTATRSFGGAYILTASSAVFTADKTAFFGMNTFQTPLELLPPFGAFVSRISATQIRILTFDNSTQTDDVLSNTSLEIRVYN